MPEGAEWLAIFLEVGRIVAVHEAIAAGLELGIDARRGFQLERPGSGAGDNPAGNARPAQSFDRSFATGDGLADGLTPLDRTAQVRRDRPGVRRKRGGASLRYALQAPPLPLPQARRSGESRRRFPRGRTS